MILADFQRGAAQRGGPAGMMALEEAVARFGEGLKRSIYRPWALVEATSRGTGVEYTVKARPWQFIDCDPLRGSFDVLLPPATDPLVQHTPIIVKTHSRCFSQRVTVRAVDSGRIDESTSVELGGLVDAVWLWSDGKRWRRVCEYRPFKWRGVYALDFTEQADQTIVNGANTIDGKTWTARNVGNCTSFVITEGVGLVITASTTNTDCFNATDTAPAITLPLLGGALTNYAVGNYIVRVQAHVELSGANANYEGVRLFVEDSTAPTNQSFQVNKFFNTSAMDLEALSTVSATTTSRGADTAAMSSDDILALIFEAPKTCEAGSGVYDGSGYLNAENPWHSESQNMASPLMYLNSQPRTGVRQCTVNTNGSLVTTVKRMQWDVHERHPFRNP